MEVSWPHFAGLSTSNWWVSAELCQRVFSVQQHSTVARQCFPSCKGLFVFLLLRSVHFGHCRHLNLFVVGQRDSLEISSSAETEKLSLSILKSWWPFSRTFQLLQSFCVTHCFTWRLWVLLFCWLGWLMWTQRGDNGSQWCAHAGPELVSSL